MWCKCLGTKPKQEEITLLISPQNSLELLPHWHRLPKWAKSLESQYNMCSSIRCVFLKIRVEYNTHIQWWIVGGRQTILRIQRLQKEWYDIKTYQERSKQSKDTKRTNQSNDPIPIDRNQLKDTNWTNQSNDPTSHTNNKYYDMSKGVF